MEDCSLQRSLTWLKDMSKGVKSHELEAITLDGLQIVRAQKDSVSCKFIVTNSVSDKNGNWHVGPKAALIDDVGLVQYTPELAKVVGDKGGLASVLVEVRRRHDGDLIALGKQWMASNSNARQASKL